MDNKIVGSSNEENSEDSSSISSENIVDFTKAATIEGNDESGYYIKVSKDVFDKFEENLKDKDVEPKDLGLTNFDCFKTFIETEIKTQFPDLGNVNIPSDSEDIVTNGCIKIKRAKINNNNQSEEIYLKYTTKQKFEEMCNNNDLNALNFFTLDEEGKLIIASDSYIKVVTTTSGDTSIATEIPASKEETTVTEESPIDYRSAVNKYSMPFAFSLDILATSGGEDIALGMNELAKSSEMEITVEVTVQENHSEENYAYRQRDEGDKKFFYRINEKQTYEGRRPEIILRESGTTTVEASPNEKNCTVNVVTDTRYNTCNVELTKVDSWIAKAEKTYQPAEVENTSSGPTTSQLDPIRKDANPDDYDVNTDSDVKRFMNRKITYWKNVIAREEMPEGCTDRSIIGQATNLDVSNVDKVTYTTQTSSSTSTTRKYDVTTKETVSNEQKVFDVFDNNEDSFRRMEDAEEFLYSELEENANTINFSDIMRYLINKYLDPNYDGTLDLSIFDLEDFNSIIDGVTGSILADYIRLWENFDLYKYYKGITSTSSYASGEYYKTYGDGHINIAYGQVIDTTWNDEVFRKHGVEPSVLHGYGSGQVFRELTGAEVEEVFEEIANNTCEATKSAIDSSILSRLSENQIHALTAVKYQYGNIGNFNSVYAKYSQGDKSGFRSSFTVNGGHPFLRGVPPERGEANWKLFDQGIYEGKGITLNPSDYISMGGSPEQFLRKAAEVKAYIVNNNYSYTQNPNNLPSNKDSYKNVSGVCCATYVTWVMHEAGLDDYIGNNINLVSGVYSKLKEKNVTEIKFTNESVLKEGDILFYKKKYDDGTETDFTHIDIYAGNGKKWNAGSSSSVRINGTENLYTSGSYQTDQSGRRYKSTLVFAMRLNFQGSGGEWKPNAQGINIGTFTSGITGKTFTIINQMKVNGWGSKCNRALATSMLSAYVRNSTSEIVNYTGAIWAGADNNEYFGKGNLKSENLSTATSYKEYVKNRLPQGHYIAMHIGNSNYHGKSGKKWSSSMHWVGILGYKIENGKIKIFVADVGHGNTGWYDLDEFDTATIDHIEDVQRK